MNVKLKNKNEYMFLDIPVGYAFIDCSGNICIKIAHIDFKFHGFNDKLRSANAVSVENMAFRYYNDDDNVSLMEYPIIQ